MERHSGKSEAIILYIAFTNHMRHERLPLGGNYRVPSPKKPIRETRRF